MTGAPAARCSRRCSRDWARRCRRHRSAAPIRAFRRRRLVPHAHALVGAQARGVEPLPGAGRAQHALAGARDRRHAQLRRRLERRGRRGGSCDRQQHDALARAMPCVTRQQRRGAGAGEPAADHDSRRRRALMAAGAQPHQRQAARQSRQRPPKPQLRRDSARLAGGLQIEQQQAEIAQRAIAAARGRRTASPDRSVKAIMPRRSAARRRCELAPARARAPGSLALAISSASTAASRSPRLKPCAATGCSACAALPISATRGADARARAHQSQRIARAPPDLQESARAPAEALLQLLAEFALARSACIARRAARGRSVQTTRVAAVVPAAAAPADRSR